MKWFLQTLASFSSRGGRSWKICSFSLWHQQPGVKYLVPQLVDQLDSHLYFIIQITETSAARCKARDPRARARWTVGGKFWNWSAANNTEQFSKTKPNRCLAPCMEHCKRGDRPTRSRLQRPTYVRRCDATHENCSSNITLIFLHFFRIFSDITTSSSSWSRQVVDLVWQ